MWSIHVVHLLLSQNRCNCKLHSLEGDGILAVVWFAVPDEEAGLFAGLQLKLGLLARHAAMVPAEGVESKKYYFSSAFHQV